MVLKSDLVELGLLHKFVLLVLAVEEGEDHDGEGGEDDVVDLEDPLLVEDLAGEGGVEAEPELGHDEEHVLVEGVGDEVGVSAVGFSAVDEQEVLEVLKLSNSIVRSRHSLLSLNPTDAHSDMCSSDHVDVVGTISDGEGYGGWVVLLD